MRSIQVPQVIGGELAESDVQEAVREFAAAYGVNQALFLVAAALTELAERDEREPSITELALQVERLAQMAQRAAL